MAAALRKRSRFRSLCARLLSRSLRHLLQFPLGRVPVYLHSHNGGLIRIQLGSHAVCQRPARRCDRELRSYIDRRSWERLISNDNNRRINCCDGHVPDYRDRRWRRCHTNNDGQAGRNSPPPDFSIWTFPTQGQIIEGSSGSFSVSTNYSNGFNSAIALSASGLPAGDTITFGPATIPAPGYGSSTVNVVVGPNTAPGVYPITITGTGDGITHSVTYTLTIPTPDFKLYATLGGSVYLGGTDSFSVQVVGSNGFNSAIGLSVSGQPAGVTVTYNPASFPAPGNGEGSILLSVASTTVPGTYPITLTATGGGVTHSMTANMSVLQPPNFSLTVSPATLVVYQGATAISTITSTISGGFNSPIYLDAGGPGWFGINIGLSPSPLPAPGSGTSTITIGVAPFVQPGTYIIPIGGYGGGINQNNAATISLTVLQAPSFGSTNVGF